MLRSPTPPSSGRAFTGSLSRSRVVRIRRHGKGDQQQQQKHSITNDENDRRLSNGNVGGCTTLSVGHDIVGSGRSGKPLKPPSPASQSWSPPGVLSLASPPCEDHRSLLGAVNECGGSGGSEDGGGESWGSSSSSTALGSPWHHVVRGSDDLSEELISFVSETRILSPAVSSVLSRMSSVTTEGNSGIEEGGVGEEVNDNHDTPPDIDVDGDGGGDGDGVTRAVEGNGSGVTEKNQQGGNGGSGGGDSGSADSISVGNIAGLSGSRAGRLTSRRDPVAKSQRLQPQSTKQDSDQPMERTRWGGWREAGTGTSAAAEASCRSSSRAIVAAKVGGRRKNVVGTSGGTGGEEPRNEQCMTVVKSSKGPCTSSDTTGAITKSREPKTRIPSTPSSKKPLATSSTTTPITTIATTSRSKKKQQQQQRRSKWAVKPNEPRQPPCKPTDTPKARIPQRTKGGKMNTKSKLSRPKGTASGDERSGGGGTGGDGSRGDVSGGAASGGARSSRSKRPTPRVSASRHMAWERTLRTTTNMPSSTKSKSPPGKKDALQRAMQLAGKGDGDGGDEEDGRPSVGAWTTAQRTLQMLKELTGTDDEELQWLAVAKEGKGVETSEKRQESAETEYHRLLCQESVQQAGLKVIKDRRLEVALKFFGKLGVELERVTEFLEELREKEMTLIAEDEEAEHQASIEVDEAVAKAATAELEAAEAGASLEDDEAVTVAGTAVEAAVSAAETSRASRHAQRENLEHERVEAEEKLRILLEDIAIAREKLGALGAVLKEECREVPGGCGSALETVVGITADVCSARELIAPARAKSGLRSLEGAAKTLVEELNETRGDSQSALVRMEKWRERKEALPEYAKELADKEKAWSEREAAANEEALRRTRALVPVGVTGLTVAQLEQRAIEAGSLYPRELALRLKENRLLHWVVTHQDDIARSNFLRGDHAHFFTNLDQYDLVELRAVLACLPDKFEVDADGRKAAWRAAFMQRVQGLVAQERRETVSGGWDPELQARRQVQLPKLTAEQTRRKEYYYPTVAEVEQKVEKLHERQRRLEAKQAKLAQVKDELLPEAKEEYANVLEDTRHPANKEAFKPEDLRRARDEAKAEVERLSKEARRLEADVASAQRALRESPYTVESLQAEAEATHRLLTERARKACVLASSQEAEEEMEVGEGLEVQGGFDQTPELKSRFADKISSLRFVTAEEDARMRKEELASVFAARNKTVAAADEGEEPSSLKTAVKEASEEGSGSSGEEEQGNARAGDSAATGDAGEEQEINKERMKAFGAILEKTLSQTMLERAPLSGIAAGAAVSAGVGPAAGGKTRMMPPTRPPQQQQQQQQQQSENKGPAIVTPLCQPKSKFFRSIRSPPAASQVDGNGSGTAGGMGRPLVPHSPPPAPMMGLLAQIRGAKGGHGGGSGVVGEKGTDDSMLGTGADSGTAPLPLPLPQPPASSLPPRSLFAAAGASAVAVATVQGPPPDFLAQLRAKAAEKQALRRAAEEETGIN